MLKAIQTLSFIAGVIFIYEGFKALRLRKEVLSKKKDKRC